MVEVARLESVYRFIAYRGFESPSLRQEHESSNKWLSAEVQRRPEKAALAPATAAFLFFGIRRHLPAFASIRSFWGHDPDHHAPIFKTMPPKPGLKLFPRRAEETTNVQS